MLPTFDIPPVGPRAGKCWGDTQLVFAHNSVEMHLIRARPGYRCSRHWHYAKWNRFIVTSGKLIIRVFRDDDTMDETVLTPGQVTDVPPGVQHEFEATEHTIAIECYWTSLDPQDITREIAGGTVPKTVRPVGGPVCEVPPCPDEPEEPFSISIESFFKEIQEHVKEYLAKIEGLDAQ